MKTPFFIAVLLFTTFNLINNVTAINEDDINCDPDRYYFIPYGDNCTMYVHCAFGNPVIHTCAEGTLFDPEEEKCVLEENYVCPNTICDPDRYYFIPYGDNCTMYIHCVFGNALIRSCAEGTLFDPAEEKCVLEEYYVCPNTITTTTPEDTTQVNLFPCPNDPFIYVQHPDSCSLFYLCIHGEFNRTISCGEDRWFDTATQNCVKPEESDCNLESLPTTTTEANLFPCPNDPFIYVQHPDSCSLFYLCKHGQYNLTISCGSDRWFDTATQNCVKPQESDCTLESLPTTSTETGLYPCPNDPFIYVQHPNSCSLFYLCMNGEFNRTISCGEDRWFDSGSQNCVKPEDSDCRLL